MVSRLTNSHRAPVLATSVKVELNKSAVVNGSAISTNQKHHPLLLQESVIAGALKEFIFCGRLDNLCMSFCSLKSRKIAVKELFCSSVTRAVVPLNWRPEADEERGDNDPLTRNRISA
ncbi:probable aspartyl aminopeptidase [Phtheirospermum japonicum]|uniref:Probable aspartyl aminopeptidase n=1 Tax=Phtheirospermum japonicum TaxID=374723 RepID=A0A830BNB5_9LAMI|nr:probable aspartyl aminopeptidase [Phtheirospermum japonicum]